MPLVSLSRVIPRLGVSPSAAYRLANAGALDKYGVFRAEEGRSFWVNLDEFNKHFPPPEPPESASTPAPAPAPEPKPRRGRSSSIQIG